jgi:hypothetical protein
MKTNTPTKLQDLRMDRSLYQHKIRYLKKVLSIEDILQIKFSGVHKEKIRELSLIQNHIPFNLQMELKMIIKDSIDYYERQIAAIDNMISQIDF